MVNDATPSIIGCKDGVVSIIYNHMQKLGLQNELIDYTTHQQILTDKALE